MKKKLIPHPKGGGPGISIDLEDVSMIEEYGDRSSDAGWVEVVLTLRNGQSRSIKLSAEDVDGLVKAWENKPVTP
jgi:hypothetical protein